ncbi:hypothetical protein T07_6710 [Trichinella nelsoni]|uniref:Uncharacterized protein n=1 Tax=Trichinella nelsoni TaxID=6336 RepID=A0A0V0SD90_9BILA|nr:hypothetical protein T07_6710 [Trichinella nelsoni]
MGSLFLSTRKANRFIFRTQYTFAFVNGHHSALKAAIPHPFPPRPLFFVYFLIRKLFERKVKLGVKIVKRIIEREEKKVGQNLFNVTPAKTVPGLSVKRFNACRRRLNWAQKLRVNSVNLVTSWPVWDAWTYVVVVLSFNLWCETVGGCKFAQF